MPSLAADLGLTIGNLGKITAVELIYRTMAGGDLID
jgi:hypothetical protein